VRCRLLIVVILVLSACTAGSDTPTGARSSRPDAIVVTSFNFTESRLLGEIYAQALEHAGLPVRRELDLGPRELVQPALAQGFVDVVPEYLGTALRSVRPDSTVDAHDPGAVRAALIDAFAPWSVSVLQPSSAQDQNGLVMMAARADALAIRTTSDLAARASALVLGGPAECPSRPLCLLGLEQVYGLHFASFIPFENQAQERTALEQGVIDVAVMFTTDGRLADPDLRLLVDDRRLQPAENIVPVVADAAASRFGARLAGTLDAVSAALTEENLRFLNWRVDVEGRDPAAEAAGWLSRHPPA
jgi:osmoprotectant transport system substrate-binding protein